MAGPALGNPGGGSTPSNISEALAQCQSVSIQQGTGISQILPGGMFSVIQGIDLDTIGNAPNVEFSIFNTNLGDPTNIFGLTYNGLDPINAQISYDTYISNFPNISIPILALGVSINGFVYESSFSYIFFNANVYISHSFYQVLYPGDTIQMGIQNNGDDGSAGVHTVNINVGNAKFVSLDTIKKIGAYVVDQKSSRAKIIAEQKKRGGIKMENGSNGKLSL